MSISKTPATGPPDDPDRPGEAPPARRAPSPSPAPPAGAADRAGPRYEVEAKFDIGGAEAFDRLHQLADLAGRYPLARGRLLILSDIYVDTPAFALLRAGLVLRVRQDEGRPLVTIKALEPGGVHGVFRRLEIEGAVPPGGDPFDPGAWPAAVRDLVLPLAGRRPTLLPAFYLVHAREQRAVHVLRPSPRLPNAHARSPVVGEFVLEKVRVSEPDTAGRRGGAPQLTAAFAEAEFELQPEGSAADLEAISRWLGEQRDVTAANRSKFERALRAVAVHPPGGGGGAPGIQPAMAMAEAGRLIWRGQLVEMLLREAGVRRGDDLEFVHKMRVATRRARAAGAIFGPYFEPEAIAPFLRDLRRTARRLGRVRDPAGARATVAKYRRRAPAAGSAGLEALDAAWAGDWRRARERLLGWLDGKRYRRFIAALHRFCAAPGAGVATPGAGAGAPAAGRVRRVLPGVILERFATVRAYEAVLDGEPPEATLHALRIDCKALRYSLEFARHLLGEPGAELIKQLKKLQDHLGDLNDAVVARDVLIAAHPELLAAPGVRTYLERQERTVRKLRVRFPRVWQSFIAAKNRETLMRALARI